MWHLQLLQCLEANDAEHHSSQSACAQEPSSTWTAATGGGGGGGGGALQPHAASNVTAADARAHAMRAGLPCEHTSLHALSPASQRLRKSVCADGG